MTFKSRGVSPSNAVGEDRRKTGQGSRFRL